MEKQYYVASSNIQARLTNNNTALLINNCAASSLIIHSLCCSSVSPIFNIMTQILDDEEVASHRACLKIPKM